MPALYSTPKDQTQSLEKVQRRALQIIVGDISYDSACSTLDLPSLI